MLEPVLAIVVAWVRLAGCLDVTQLAGAAATLAGISLAQTSRQASNERPSIPRMPTRRMILAMLLGALVAALLAATAAQARGLTTTEESLLTSMNAVRQSHGLGPLRVDVHLLRAARGHSADMVRRQYFAHGSVAGRAVRAGARGPVFGEDLAWSSGLTTQWVVSSWLASPAHRAVLLRPGFRRVGIGIVFGTFAGRGGAGVVTADFAGR